MSARRKIALTWLFQIALNWLPITSRYMVSSALFSWISGTLMTRKRRNLMTTNRDRSTRRSKRSLLGNSKIRLRKSLTSEMTMETMEMRSSMGEEHHRMRKSLRSRRDSFKYLNRFQVEHKSRHLVEVLEQSLPKKMPRLSWTPSERAVLSQ